MGRRALGSARVCARVRACVCVCSPQACAGKQERRKGRKGDDYSARPPLARRTPFGVDCSLPSPRVETRAVMKNKEERMAE